MTIFQDFDIVLLEKADITRNVLTCLDDDNIAWYYIGAGNFLLFGVSDHCCHFLRKFSNSQKERFLFEVNPQIGDQAKCHNYSYEGCVVEVGFGLLWQRKIQENEQPQKERVQIQKQGAKYDV